MAELIEIVQAYARCIEWVDRHTQTQRGAHIRSFKSLTEPQAVRQIDERWAVEPGTVLRTVVGPRGGRRTRVNVRYPDIPRATCDHVFSTLPGEDQEWAIEVKNIATVGGNGGKNDFGVGKVLSPYLKDRSLMHDVARLKYHRLAPRHAVVGYAFNYSEASCDEAAVQHPGAAQIARIRSVIDGNGGTLSIRPLLDFADSILLSRGMVKRVRVEAPFTAWGHPAGGNGVVFGVGSATAGTRRGLRPPAPLVGASPQRGGAWRGSSRG